VAAGGAARESELLGSIHEIQCVSVEVAVWAGQGRNKKYQFSWFERQPEPSRNLFVSCNELFHPHPAGKVVQEYSGK
jgi:hypothetical protein